jgi:hypothetical protein
MGHKPSVAFANQALAVKNIEIKRDALKAGIDWCLQQPVESVEVGSVDALKKALPKSVRQFNAWTGDGLSVAIKKGQIKFVKNANQTLSKNPKLYAEVRFMLDRVREIKNAPNPAERRTEVLAAVARRAAHAEALRLIAERELITLKRSNNELRLKVEAMTYELRALKREATSTIENLRKQLLPETKIQPVKPLGKSGLQRVK